MSIFSLDGCSLLSQGREESEFVLFFIELSQSKKNSEIKPPLCILNTAVFTAAGLLLCGYHSAVYCALKTLVFAITQSSGYTDRNNLVTLGIQVTQFLDLLFERH